VKPVIAKEFEQTLLLSDATRRWVFVGCLFTITPITRYLLSCEHHKRCMASMPARKMRVELFDSEGNKYSIAFEGQITRDKAVRLLDLVELLGGMPVGSAANPNTGAIAADAEQSKFEKVRTVASKQFPLVWFSSRELQTAFEQECKQPISISTTATYLARLAGKGVLLKMGPSNSLRYKIAPAAPQATLRQQLQ